jgi:hypothetical protein
VPILALERQLVADSSPWTAKLPSDRSLPEADGHHLQYGQGFSGPYNQGFGMRNVVGKLSRPSVFLASEFVIIVLGVLVALAFDNWNQERQDRRTRDHLIESLLSDLREDEQDYAEFVADCNARYAAASFIDERSADSLAWTDSDYTQARDALRRLGSTSRLETVESTFREMSALGSAATIEDSELRLKISYYYGLARDRSDLNDLLLPGILRYRASLEEMGISYVDHQRIDVDAVMKSEKTLAIIRELGSWAKVVAVVADLQEANRDLISRLEALQKQ